MAQVSGSALAAVVAAKLASTLGVYGTILGAGVISVIATCGGPVFQHLFKRTGEQMRDVTGAARPRARQVPLPADPSPTRPLPADPSPTRPLPAGSFPRGPLPGEHPAPAPYGEEFGAATTHGTRLRGRRRPLLAAALVFGVTMGGITAYELVSGEDFSGGKGATTVGSVVRGGGNGDGRDTPERPVDPAPAGSATPGEGGAREDGGRPDDAGTATPSTGATPGTGTGEPDGDASTAPAPDPTPSGSAGGTTGPATPPPAPSGPTADPTAPEEPGAPSGDAGAGTARQDASTAPPSGTGG